MAHDDDGPVVLSEREHVVLHRLEQDLGAPAPRPGPGCDTDVEPRPPGGDVALALLATVSAIWIAAFVAGELAGLAAGLVAGPAAVLTLLLRRRGRRGVPAHGHLTVRSRPGDS
ncbi:hypothetical protein [Pseudonocardia sp.]|uniref:hypothetical protein n=1 Tax=Pseudonocardia sp. TaxID=60912 RepID=UPI00261755AF|nr:hypothetical protein [Pseudonocardia sp.]